jgi:hypothetical protein
MSNETTGTEFNLDPADQTVSLYCPTSVEITEKHSSFAPRLTSFEGKRIGLLWNGKPNGDFFLNRAGDLLKKKYNNINIVKFWEIDPGRTAHADKKSKETLDYIAQNADLVLADLGD